MESMNIFETDEFKHFIAKDIRLEPVVIGKDQTTDQLLEFYMGKNTPDRQLFILENLVVEDPDIDKKVIIPFQINKVLSMNPYYIDVINQCQQYTVGILKPREVFKLYNDLLPKQKQFNKFIKAKKNTTKINDKLIQYFSDYYLCSKKEAEEYISLLSKKGDINAILNIVQKYGISKQDALKFLK